MPSNEGGEIILGLLHPPTSNFYAIWNGYVFNTIKDLSNNAVSEHYQALYC
jgi:hypothetical protein